MPQKYFTIEGFATLVHHTGTTTLPEVPPDLSRGECIVCMHGAGGNGAVFGDLMERLAEAHSPIAFDQPAHGRSGGLDSLGSVERMSAFARSLCEKLAIARPVLLGHSMGGAVALRYALDQPEGVRALVLVGSAGRFEVPHEHADQLRRVTEGKERRQFSREAYSPATPPEILRRGFMEDLKTDPRAAYGDLLACRDFDLEARLAEVAAPTLVVVGEDEMPLLKQGSQRLADGIPAARSIEIEKAGHMVPLEQPAKLAEALSEFLGGLSG